MFIFSYTVSTTWFIHQEKVKAKRGHIPGNDTAWGMITFPGGLIKVAQAGVAFRRVWIYRCGTLPSHVCVLHRASSVCSPMQISPPLAGAGLLQERVRW